ncbi:MAG: ice-binding family protein [Bacteroidota bacterium]
MNIHTINKLSRWTRFVGAMVSVALMISVTAMSQSLLPVNIGSTSNFSILAGSLISNVPTSAVIGDIGLSPAAGSSVTGFGLTEVTGIIYTVDATGPVGSVIDATKLTTAQGDLTIAYNDAAGRTPIPTGTFLNPGSGNIGGLTLVPGLYKFTSDASITGSDVTLTGSATDVWIFQIAAGLNVGTGVKVILAGGAKASNIFWQVGTSATLGTTSVFKGTIMADQSISLNTSASVEGRLLARIAAVTLASNAVTNSTIVTSQAPLLESPADLATNLSTSVELKWFAAVGDSVYHLQIDTSNVFNTTVYNDSTLTGVLYNITNLKNGTTYFWRVSVKDSAKNSVGTSAYSTIRSFTTLNSTPIPITQAPLLELPADLATNQSTTIELKWFAAVGDSVYHLQIDTSKVFSSTVYNDSTLAGILHKITGLKNATTYYWRVSVKDSAKNGIGTSPYSIVRSFTTWNVTPTTPLLPVTLGMTDRFAILSYAGITNTGPSTITGDVGVSPLAASYMTGFGTPNIVGTIYGVDATGPEGSVVFPSMLTQAMGDLTTAFNDAAGRTVDPIGVSGNLGGLTLYSGLYKSTGSLEISSSDLTLDAQGDTAAVWIFQIASSFDMTSGRQVFLSGGAKASNIFWQMGSAATFGTTTVMKGTIMAYTTITFATGASLEGRALARTADITLQSNTIGKVAVVTSVRSENIPQGFTLSQNYPNPFNPTTNIEFTVPSNGRATLIVFNAIGQEVATLFNGEAEAGKYNTVQFNASGLATGLYFSRLEFGGIVQLKKMMLVK